MWRKMAGTGAPRAQGCNPCQEGLHGAQRRPAYVLIGWALIVSLGPSWGLYGANKAHRSHLPAHRTIRSCQGLCVRACGVVAFGRRVRHPSLPA